MRDLGSGFTGEVEGCDLGAIQSRSRRVRSRRALSLSANSKGAIRRRSRNQTAKSKGIKGIFTLIVDNASSNGASIKFLQIVTKD